ncbi:histidine kinase [Luteibacter rhizovicinus DSM 16549]|uniref:histidine kinase n=1 Tax=Luteibacter rhizovicinus DSM 16549 TaxID=1440763 RepID=A0A0G9H9G2_9GAMM|nr:sensor histidine kinase KdpD [Luteibacter rhizovicinus]APG03804.1 histidine kinase [Luteibacter rhizovicinus DSM 16549]KLD64327.1 histidine kinase [Luteibacter rhizovicinus DSM 16549]KLD75163.1 histidine kinase [Xanthomonas hyacinthi DSM 19077]
MTDDRDARANALLSTASDEDGQRLKVFLGAAPGVGKTYAMLSAARDLKRQGIDVVVGLVETHGRSDTVALVEGLEVLPTRPVRYAGRDFREFDLEAALLRRPAVLLVDELAHTNLPGGRHTRRWQDIAELLDAGIEVYTALNVQHLESLNDQIRRITGVAVRETVPDAFLDRARDIVLVDLPPRELIGRLKQGKVYVPETAAVALDKYFSPTNLAALRELAVETVAAHVDSDLREIMLARGDAMPVRRRCMAAIDGQGQSEYLVRITRRIAERRGSPWSVVFVDRGGLDADRRERVDAAMRLARRLGGEGVILRGHAVADELLTWADREGVGQIIVGRTRERPIARRLGFSLTQQLLRRGAHLELTIVATPAERARARRRLRFKDGHGSRREYAFATGATAIAMALSFVADRFLSVANLSLIFLTAVLVVAVRTRMAVAVYTALLCFFGYNFFFAPPRYTLAIANADDVLAVVLFLVVALVCSRLATRLAGQVTSLRAAQVRARALVALGQQLATSADADSIRKAGASALARALSIEIAMLARDANGHFKVMNSVPDAFALSTQDLAAAEWCESHAEPAGRYTDTLHAASCWMLPLGAEHQRAGVVALRFPLSAREPDADRRSLALAMVQDIGQALDRARLAHELEGARVQGETERLRSALLSSVSHDLRSPLASMIGSAGTLLSYDAQLPANERHELLQAILGEGQRLDRYIQNLLDMTRLGHGTLQLHRDWVDAGEIVAAAVSRMRKLFPDVRIDVHLPTDTVLLHVHPALIEQALFNILENAGRFTPPEEPIRVTVRSEAGRLLVDVADRGPGIPEDERARIFDMFYSVTRGDRGGKGTGLGLAICRGMIGAHGGSVEALPHVGGGTTIRVSLPLSPPPESNA